MKIKVNQTETYEIDIPDEVTMEQFMGLQQRFNHICKVLSKDTFGVMLSASKTLEVRGPRGPYKPRKTIHPLFERPWCKSRNETIKILKIAYYGSKEEKNEYAKSVNRLWEDISKAISKYRRMWEIKPKEVGLTRFPRLGEGHSKNLQLLKINQKESEHSKYDIDIKHFSKDGQYLCNPSVDASEEKLTNNWYEVTCDNCKARRFKNADTEEEKEEDS